MDLHEDIRVDSSTLVNRNVTVCGRRTSVRLEQPMWDALEEICRRERKLLNQIATDIDQRRRASNDGESSLTAAIRVYIMKYFWQAATERGHQHAGHGVLPKGNMPTVQRKAGRPVTQRRPVPVSVG